MGRLFLRLIDETEGFEVHAGLSSKDALEGILGADLVVDVTVPAVSPEIVEKSLRAGIPVLVGTSGWSEPRLATLARVVAEVDGPGVLVVPNFSVGSVLATTFATMAARFYESVEIVETHHPGKVDSPSGTAIRTAELIAEARRDLGPVQAPHVDQRARGQQVASVPVHSLRLPGVDARQEVVFGAPGETLRLVHDTTSQAAYVQGILVALAAAPSISGVVVGLDKVLPLVAPTDGGTSR
ncbi:MAG: 4-hydroxy-tetrahydrodipicolinate reductase [Frondihabitans sp.]|nr:4-hydroxy-tetrahydrodipicolinate reductase [Frondihabitans sp.]